MRSIHNSFFIFWYFFRDTASCMKYQFNYRNNLLILAFIPAVFWLYIAFHPQLSYYGYGGGDNVMHYLISCYAFSHPELFFHHWGKPVFTIISSPFAQFGIQGIYIFNIVVSLLACIIAYYTAKTLKLQYASLTVFFTAFAPVFFLTATTALTEPLFSLFIISGIFLFLKRKFIFSAFVFSFTVWIRSESIVLFPVFVIAYSLARQWKSIPFLLAGFVIISLAGKPFYKDFLWFFTQMPYSLGESIYGKGGLFHFVIRYNKIFGMPLTVFALTGVIYIISRFVKDKTYRNINTFSFYVMLFGIPLVFFSAHSWVWFKGIGGSLGLIRVMSCIIPLVSVAGAIGYSFLIKHISSEKLKKQIFVVICILVFLTYKLQHGLIIKAGEDELLIRKTAEYIKNSEYSGRKVFFYNPLIPLCLKLDPWSKYSYNMIEKGLHSFDILSSGDIYIWDAHFGANEGNIKPDSLFKIRNLKHIKTFTPEVPFTVLGGYNYEIHCFEKIHFYEH